MFQSRERDSLIWKTSPTQKKEDHQKTFQSRERDSLIWKAASRFRGVTTSVTFQSRERDSLIWKLAVGTRHQATNLDVSIPRTGFINLKELNLRGQSFS